MQVESTNREPRLRLSLTGRISIAFGLVSAVSSAPLVYTFLVQPWLQDAAPSLPATTLLLLLAPLALACLFAALWLARSMRGAMERVRMLAQALGEGRHEVASQVRVGGGLSDLMREMLAMCATIERRATEEATRQREQEVEQLRKSEEQARRLRAAEHARQVQELEARLLQLEHVRQGEAQEHRVEVAHEREREHQQELLLQVREEERNGRELHRRQLAEDFEWQVASILEQVQSSVEELRATAGQMAHLAGDSARRSTDAAEMSRRTDETAAQVARATAALSESATRMRGQAEASRAGARTAVEEAADAASAINALFEATTQIGSIAGIISEITRQTSLLSINARIEAARAGEAGRGFAVVASEVMELASRTRKATDSIDEQIQQVTLAAQRSADVLTRLGQRIGELGNAAGTIFDTAETQCRSTLDISERMGLINKSTKSVTAGIQAALGTASEARQRSSEVLDAAGRMDEQTRRMQEQVARFVLDIQDCGAHAAAAHDAPEEKANPGQNTHHALAG